MVEILDKNDCVIHTSKNLRGLISYMHNNSPRLVLASQNKDDGGSICVFFQNDDVCYTTFASFKVMLEWIKNRRGMQGAELEIDDIHCGTVSKDNSALL